MAPSMPMPGTLPDAGLAPGGSRVVLTPRAVTLTLGSLAVLLGLADLAGGIAEHVYGRDSLMGLVPLFDLKAENNLPTWFASMLLLIAAGQLCGIGLLASRDGEHDARTWFLLAAILLLMSIDEVASIHEHVGDQLARKLGGGSVRSAFFAYHWVLVGLPLAALVGLAFLRFVLRRPPRIRRLILLSGGVFLAGALGMEMIGARHHSLYGDANLTFELYTGLEEMLEMAGVILFIHALSLELASRRRSELRLEWRP